MCDSKASPSRKKSFDLSCFKSIESNVDTDTETQVGPLIGSDRQTTIIELTAAQITRFDECDDASGRTVKRKMQKTNWRQTALAIGDDTSAAKSAVGGGRATRRKVFGQLKSK